MVDEYELISRKELEALRSQNISPLTSAETNTIPKTDTSTQIDTSKDSKILALNNNLEKLNSAVQRMVLLFEQAQKDIIEKKPEKDDLEKLYTQGDKIANGMMSMANMIRDQQIQLNQLSMLYKRQQDLLMEIRLQRRQPSSTFKIPPKIMEQPKEMSNTPDAKDSASEIDIKTGPKIQDQILKEEKQEDYATLKTLEKDDPPPPPPQKKSIMSRIMKK